MLRFYIVAFLMIAVVSIVSWAFIKLDCKKKQHDEDVKKLLQDIIDVLKSKQEDAEIKELLKKVVDSKVTTGSRKKEDKDNASKKK